MSDVDIMAKEASSFKEFVKEFYKEFRDFPKNRDAMKWLEDTYKSVSEGTESDELERVADALPQTVEEMINEISLSSAGVRDFLRALYRNNKILKKLGFSNFKGAVDYIRSNGGRDWDELRDEATGFGLKFESIESLDETAYNLGNDQFTRKNMTPTQILDLAMAYSQTSGNKMYGNKMPRMINVANDLANLNGTTQLNAKMRGKEPALILFLLKNGLVSKDEYVKLYKDLIEKQISVVKALKNADPASRMVGGAAARAAHKDMKGEFEEGVNSPAYKGPIGYDDGCDCYPDEIDEALGNDKSMLALVDILSNSMEHYDEKDFLQTIRGGQGWSGIAGFQNSSLIPIFKSIYKKYWTVSPKNRTNWSLKDWIKWLKPFGLEESINKEEVTEGDGLWANIRAKRARGEKPAHGNSDAHKDAVAAGKKINKEESVTEEAKRDYKAEYKKFQSSTESKKYRAELNKYNRDKGTYGNGDGKDASHKNGKIVGFEAESVNRGRAEKSRLKKESTTNEAGCGCGCGCGGSTLKENTEPSIISQLRDIVKHNQNKVLVDPKSGKKIRVDLYSASAITQVYDAFKQQSNKDKFVSSGLLAMQSIAFKLLK